MATKNKYEPKDNCTVFNRWCRELLDLYETEKQFMKGSDRYTVSHLGLQRWILAKKLSGTDGILQKLLLDSVLSANQANNSGIYVPWFLYNEIEDVQASRTSSSTYKDYALAQSKNTEVHQLFSSLFDIAGPLTKIIVKPSSVLDPVLKYKNNFQFPLKLDAQFHRMIGHNEYIEQSNPIIIMIEGAPETVGEINNLLEWNHVEKRPVVLIARSFPEEISATLATNWLKGSLSIVPLVYGDSIDTINLAADIVAVSKGELISAHFGDLISVATMDTDKWGTCDRIEWTSKGLSIYKDVDVSAHIRKLLNKITKTDNEELVEIYENRIVSLSNDSIVVQIPDKQIQTIEELKKVIEHYNCFVISGMTHTPLGVLPAGFVEIARQTAKTLREEILNIGGFLVRIDDEMVA